MNKEDTAKYDQLALELEKKDNNRCIKYLAWVAGIAAWFLMYQIMPEPGESAAAAGAVIVSSAIVYGVVVMIYKSMQEKDK